MTYEILVTHVDVGHYFATAKRSVTHLNVDERVADFKKRFPKSEGFGVILSIEHTTGRTYEDEALDRYLNNQRKKESKWRLASRESKSKACR